MKFFSQKTSNQVPDGEKKEVNYLLLGESKKWDLVQELEKGGFWHPHIRAEAEKRTCVVNINGVTHVFKQLQRKLDMNICRLIREEDIHHVILIPEKGNASHLNALFRDVNDCIAPGTQLIFNAKLMTKVAIIIDKTDKFLFDAVTHLEQIRPEIPFNSFPMPQGDNWQKFAENLALALVDQQALRKLLADHIRGPEQSGPVNIVMSYLRYTRCGS